MGFIEELENSAKTKKDIKKEEQIRANVVEQKQLKERQKCEKQFIKDFINITQQKYVIELIKDVCLNASKKAIYKEKMGHKQIRGYISLYDFYNRDQNCENAILNCIVYNENFHFLRKNTVDTYFKIIYFGKSPVKFICNGSIEHNKRFYNASDCIYKIVNIDIPYISLDLFKKVGSVCEKEFVSFLKKELPQFSFKINHILSYDIFEKTQRCIFFAENNHSKDIVIEFLVNF